MDFFLPFIYENIKQQHIEQIYLYIEDTASIFNIEKESDIKEEKINIIEIL